MVRGAALAVALVTVATVAMARPKKKKREPEPEPKQPRALHLRAIDLSHRLILVEVDGFAKPPPANYFTMTDERGRHYIAQTIHCDPPFPSGTQACELEIPVGYERHPLVKLELHQHDLHGPTLVVAADEVRAAWAAAEEAHAPPKTSSPATPRDGGVLDSSASQTDADK